MHAIQRDSTQLETNLVLRKANLRLAEKAIFNAKSNKVRVGVSA